MRHLLIAAELTRQHGSAKATIMLSGRELVDALQRNLQNNPNIPTAPLAYMDLYNNTVGVMIGNHVHQRDGTWEDVVALTSAYLHKSLAGKQEAIISGQYTPNQFGIITLPGTVKLDRCELKVPAIGNVPLNLPNLSLLPTPWIGKDPASVKWPDLGGKWLAEQQPPHSPSLVPPLTPACQKDAPKRQPTP